MEASSARKTRFLVGEAPVECFGALTSLSLPHGFVGRVSGVEVAHDKEEMLRRLDVAHRRVRQHLISEGLPLMTARQVHGSEIAVVKGTAGDDRCFEDCDGLITDRRGVWLGIYVADCCAVYLVDRAKRAIGLVHSGRKGTELGIVPAAIDRMSREFGTQPADLVVQLSPCIRPPHYEVDFAAEIRMQAARAGAGQIIDDGLCTACDLGSYYSYRAEKGKTGRMVALLSLGVA